MLRLLAIGVVLCLACGFTKINSLLFYQPPSWPKPNYNFSANPLSIEKRELGRALFYDTRLSRDNSVSCASCHSPYNAFTHVDHDLSHGIEDRIGTRNSPALMNLAWYKSFMWDGAIHHLDVQALAPISHPSEMDNNLVNVIETLNGIPKYRQSFQTAFGDTLISGERILKSLSQFMLSLISANSKYDQVMRKEKQFTAQEKNGYLLFKKNCSTCHREPLFTTHEFINNGLPCDTSLKDYGRYLITGKSQDSLKFKIPTLRNIEYSFPYMHDGRFKKLSEVIHHYTNLKPDQIISSDLKAPIILSANEQIDLISFLLTLSDKEFIFNTNNTYPHYFFNNQTKD